MRNQHAEHIFVPSWVSAQGPVGGLSPAQDLPAGSLVHARQCPCPVSSLQLQHFPQRTLSWCAGRVPPTAAQVPFGATPMSTTPSLSTVCSGGRRPETRPGRGLSYPALVTVSGTAETVSTGRSPGNGVCSRQEEVRWRGAVLPLICALLAFFTLGVITGQPRPGPRPAHL